MPIEPLAGGQRSLSVTSDTGCSADDSSLGGERPGLPEMEPCPCHRNTHSKGLILKEWLQPVDNQIACVPCCFCCLFISLFII